MMTSSVVNLVQAKHNAATEELTSMLEALPSSENSQEHREESAIFDDENEPASGLINRIRRNSVHSSQTITTADSLNTIVADDSTSYYSADDDTTTSGTNSTHTAANVTNEEEETENNLENDEEIHMNLLKSKSKHMFVLSENGKPVFTRYGDEEHLITLMGVMQTLVSFAELTDSNQLNYIKAGQCRIAFLHREPLIFVLISHTNEHPLCLTQQLTYIYHQIISTLTLSRIQHKFHVQPNFDLRRWLSNAEKKLLNNIVDMYERDLGMVMTCAKCLMLPTNVRGQIGQTVAQTIRGQKDMIFAIILTHGHLVTIARLKNYHLHPSDLYLLINLVNSSDAFKGVESWVPVCLPRFDSGGCLHAHISYLDDSCDVCLVLMTVNPEHFQILSEFRQKIGEKLKKINALVQIKTALGKDRLLTEEIACNELRYFAYKSRGLSQYTSSKLLTPYTTREQHVRLFELIRYVYGRLHDPSHQLKIVYFTGEHESLLGWLAPGFELHAVFSPLVTLETVTACIDRILTYIKRDESQLFIMKCEYF
ncbi:unnamed protein product [Adineta ricciae]|uniref:Vacuolar fusion protein MON1 homolog n=1 Tax=Adineta ricciae TaxID=249248 RepID=A0A813V560_ADIRI|nr:unnamed protein product [Adineta ricciae]